MTRLKIAFAMLMLSFAFSSAAHAQAQRVFVSGLGSDGNNCTLAAPCRTFAQAVSVVAAGGEVVALDSAGFGAFSINKAVTVEAGSGIYAGVSVFSGTGISINAAPADKVVLRGLTVNAQGGQNGIVFEAGTALYVENCSIDGFSSGVGIDFVGPAGDLYLKDAAIRDNSKGVVVLTNQSGTARASIDNVDFDGNNYGLYVGGGGQAAISNSTVTGNTFYGLSAIGDRANSTAELSIESCTIANNANGVVTNATFGTGSVSLLRLSNSTVTDNTSGLVDLAGTLVSRGNNTVEGNGTNVSGAVGSYLGK